MQLKKCSMCAKEKPLTEFNKGNGKYGVGGKCKECLKIYRKMRASTIKHKIPNKKQCTKCGMVKNIEEFSGDNSRLDGKRNDCKDCQASYKANWYQDNKHLANARYAKRRAMKHALPYSTSGEMWLDVIMEYNCKCAITGKDKFDLEHFIPLSWGHGGSLKNNIYPMDSSLNSSKSNKNPYKWYKQQLKGKQRTAFEKVIHNLAKENGMTNAEFRKYVYWCEKNKRTVEEVLADNEKGLTSIDLFKLSIQNEN